MKNPFTNLLLFSLIVAAFAAGVFAYPHLPNRIASHWNASGEADGYMSRFWGVFLMPLVMAGLFLLYLVIPRIDPLKENIESFRKYYNGFWFVISAFFLYIFALTLAWNLGYRFDFTAFMVPAIAGFWWFLGLLLEKSKRNWFVGIRTPWTLSSDAVWEKTHKLGGRLFKAAGIVSLAGIFISGGAAVFMVIALSAFTIAIVTVVYSYVEYTKQNR